MSAAAKLGKVADCPDCSSVDYCSAHYEAMMALPHKRIAPTQPPSAADADADAFEARLKLLGESKVRWSHVLERAESLFNGGGK